MKLLVIGGLFELAGLCEIGGYLVWRCSAPASSHYTAWSPPCNPSKRLGASTPHTMASSSRARFCGESWWRDGVPTGTASWVP